MFKKTSERANFAFMTVLAGSLVGVSAYPQIIPNWPRVLDWGLTGAAAAMFVLYLIRFIEAGRNSK
jgi:hypothetical protein